MPNTERIEKERSKAIEMAVGQIEKQFGKGSIMRLGGKGSISAIESIPTGSISIDYALGVGGVPRGRVIEIYGPEASGKTTLALQVIANAQAAGGNAAFVDAEHALDPVYSTKLGVDLDNLLVSQPDHGEQALELSKHLFVPVRLTWSLWTPSPPLYHVRKSKEKWVTHKWAFKPASCLKRCVN